MSYRSSLVSLLSVGLLVSSCAPDSGSPGGAVDLEPNSLGANGCLDLGATFSQIRAMSPALRMRTSTSVVDVLGDNLRRNFIGEASFSNFKYEERALPDVSLPEVTQTGCESLTIRTGPDGEQLYMIKASEDPSVLVIERADGHHMEWKITSTRSLEALMIIPVMDRCPLYEKAKVKSVMEYRWGSDDELGGAPAFVSRATLRAISSVVSEMSPTLLRLATFETDDLVKAPKGELAKLAKAKVDPETQDCPYRAEPPSTTEPPPPPAGSTLPGAQ
ncbi:MAG: hypothetical protein V4760_03490 [Bdellovibrionota bacterium]